MYPNIHKLSYVPWRKKKGLCTIRYCVCCIHLFIYVFFFLSILCIYCNNIVCSYKIIVCCQQPNQPLGREKGGIISDVGLLMKP